MVDVHEWLKTAAVANNAVWLRSFGSDVVVSGGLVDVRSSPISSYVGSVAYDAIAIETLLADPGLRSFYADVDVMDRAAGEVHRATGECSVMVGGRVKPVRTAHPAALELVTALDPDEWSALYSGIFDIGDAETNRRRWQLSFASRLVEHWKFNISGQPIGICQTVAAHGVTGLYSFGILQESRSVQNSLRIIRALHKLFSERGWQHLYFELYVRPASQSQRIAARLALNRLRVVCPYARTSC